MTDAYSTLSDSKLRAEYDRKLGVRRVNVKGPTQFSTRGKVYAPTAPPPGGTVYDFEAWTMGHYAFNSRTQLDRYAQRPPAPPFSRQLTPRFSTHCVRGSEGEKAKPPIFATGRHGEGRKERNAAQSGLNEKRNIVRRLHEKRELRRARSSSPNKKEGDCVIQ